jgi:hypothetical protein
MSAALAAAADNRCGRGVGLYQEGLMEGLMEIGVDLL